MRVIQFQTFLELTLLEQELDGIPTVFDGVFAVALWQPSAVKDNIDHVHLSRRVEDCQGYPRWIQGVSSHLRALVGLLCVKS